MKNFINLILFSSMLFTSCTVPLYVPNATAPPSLTEKGNLEFGLYGGSNGTDVNAAYAITNNWGAILSGSRASTQSDSSAAYRKHAFVELGGGYTKKLTDDVAKESFSVLSCFAGGGYGSAEGETYFSNILNTDIKYKNASKGNFYKIYLQPSWGWTSNHFEIFLSSRFNFVQFQDVYNSLQADWKDVIDESGKDYNVYFEPSLTMRGGSEVFKVSLQTGASIPHFGESQTVFRGRPVIFILGLHFNLNTND